jgi:glycosyltransferase involved in cell wall biosynthesis
MRVGLYIFDHRPEIGGGYTYGQEVIRAIDASRASTRHEIVAMGFSPGPGAAWSGPYLSLRAGAASRLISKAGRATRRFLNTEWTGPTGDRVDRLLKAQGIELIWAASGGTPTKNVPYVATVWDLQHRVQPFFPEVSSGQEWVARERYYASELGQAARVIVGTDAGKREIQAAYGIPDEVFRKLPHPTPTFALDAPRSSADVVNRYNLKSGYVFYPAQFWPHKNHVRILHALKRLRDEHNVELNAVFVGSDRGNEAHIRAVVRSLGLESAVRFPGFVPRETLIALYQNALALTYMSFFGPENLPPLEAFGLGCPVIAAKVAGSEEQLADAAILVEPTDDDALASAILSLIHEPERRTELARKGAERSRAFTPGDYAEGMLRIVDELEPIVRTWR